MAQMTSLSSDETQRLAANACLPTRLDRKDGCVQRSVIRPMRPARQVKQHVRESMVTCMCAIATALAREDVVPISCAYTNGLVSSIAIHLVHTGRRAARPRQLDFQSLLQHGLCTREPPASTRAPPSAVGPMMYTCNPLYKKLAVYAVKLLYSPYTSASLPPAGL